MKIHDLKFITTSNKGSTRCISLLHELEQSKTDLAGETEVDPRDSSSSKSKQMFSKLILNEWMKKFSSTMLDSP